MVKPQRCTVNVFEPEFKRFVAICKSNGDLKHTAGFRMLIRLWEQATPEQQFAAFRYDTDAPANAVGECGNVYDDVNKANRMILAVREAVDSFMSDGKIDRTEGRKLRRFCSDATKAINAVACHGNEPQPALSA